MSFNITELEISKIIKTDKYIIFYNRKNGMEVLTGVNGYDDPFVLEYPSLMDIGIMGHCSHNCKFCYQGNRNKPNMKLSDFKRIVDESKQYTTQIALGGKGSPNEHENFREILEYCVKNNITPNYTTSGRNLSDYQISLTKEFCGACAVSMYNEEFTFDSLKRLMDKGVKTNIHYVLSKKSFDDAINIIDGKDIWNGKVKLNKLNAIIFLKFKPQGNGKDLRDWILTPDQIGIFSEKIKNSNCNFKIGCDLCMICEISKIRDLSDYEKTILDTCEGARSSVYISSDLKLIPCSFGDHDIYGVDISNTPIIDAWNNSKIFKDFRNKLIDNPKQCPFGF